MDLSISIVSYNTKELLKRCIASIYKYTKGINFEVIVVDNGSKDGTIEETSNLIHSTPLRQGYAGRASSVQISNLILISNKKNLFFAKANNQALKIAKGKYFLILNSDTYFVDNSLKKMVEYMEKNPDVGACEGIEIYEDGSIMKSGSRFSTPLIDFYELSLIGKRIKNKKLVNNYRLVSKDRKRDFELDVGCDAYLMVRKDILDKIGGYDEKLLLYYTENDLCLRIKKMGYKIMHIGSSKVIHKVSASTEKLGWRKMDLYYNDLLAYYRKNGFLITGTLLFLLLKAEEQVLKFVKRNG